MEIKLDTIEADNGLIEKVFQIKLDEDEFSKMFGSIEGAYDPKFATKLRRKVVQHLGNSNWVCPFVFSIWQAEYIRYYDWVGTEFMGYPAHLFYQRTVIDVIERPDDE